MSSLVDTLAERCGIESSFGDALGNEHQTPPEIKRTLLKALLAPADDDEQAQASLDQLNRKEWLRPVPPVLVLYADKPLAVPVVLEPGNDTLRWTVQLETGETRSGKATAADLKLQESCELDGKRLERRELALEGDLPWGYHRLRLENIEGAESSLIITPGSCWLPEAAEEGRRLWGISLQLYLLRSERNWGIGDFSDLRRFAELAGERGADAIGLNPLHAMFLDQPEQASPYSPLSRYMLNALYIDVEAIPEFRSEAAQRLFGLPEMQAKLQASRRADKVDYTDAASLKLKILQPVFLEFEKSAPAERKQAFEDFARNADELLQIGCTYEALRQYFSEQSPDMRDCSTWPEPFQHANSEGVARFRQTHAELIQFHLWLQWVADVQLGEAAEATKGMQIGLYRDLAVGASPSGAEVWSNPDVMTSQAEVGAPPDEWNAAGQNWALPPFHPQQLREEQYRSFLALVRTNMRHAGGLRIDHAMGLARLYWVPRGGSPKDGAYVRYPVDDLVGILALESHRNRCIVVGEDLGTVKPGFRERMAEANILSYRLLLLERDKKGFVPRAKYPKLALATASSHDLPTLCGWWAGADLAAKEKLGITDGEEAARKAREEREKDRRALADLFRSEGVLDSPDLPSTEQFIDAAHTFLARTECLLMMAQIDDVCEEPEQVNLPASMPDQYPSWSRRLSCTLEQLATDQRLIALSERLNTVRGASA